MLPPAAQGATQRWNLSGAGSTVDQYGAAIERFEAFCGATGAQAQPAAPETVAAFLRRRRMVEKVGQASLDADARAIRQGHLACGFPDPTDHPAVRVALGRKRGAALVLEVPVAYSRISARTNPEAPACNGLQAPAQPPASALPLEELDPIVELFKLRSRAPSTRKAYANHLKRYNAFCERHGLRVLPSEVDTVCRFLTEYGLTHKPSTLGIAKAAVRWAHHAAGMFSPTDHPDVAEVMKGHAHMLGTQRKQKYAFTSDDIVAMCQAMDEEGGLHAIRDRALLLLGFAGAFRRSEISQRERYEDEEHIYLDFANIQFTRHGVRVTVRKSKTDQEAEGEEVFINYGARKNTCAVVALHTWLETLRERGISSGPVFRALHKKGGRLRGDATIRNRPLHPVTVSDRYKYWAEKIGLDRRSIGGHSVRAGHATTASENGASPFAILKQGRWKSFNTVKGYIRRSKEYRDNSSSTLGL